MTMIVTVAIFIGFQESDCGFSCNAPLNVPLTKRHLSRRYPERISRVRSGRVAACKVRDHIDRMFVGRKDRIENVLDSSAKYNESDTPQQAHGSNLESG